jgi:hypothetical protein
MCGKKMAGNVVTFAHTERTINMVEITKNMILSFCKYLTKKQALNKINENAGRSACMRSTPSVVGSISKSEKITIIEDKINASLCSIDIHLECNT